MTGRIRDGMIVSPMEFIVDGPGFDLHVPLTHSNPYDGATCRIPCGFNREESVFRAFDTLKDLTAGTLFARLPDGANHASLTFALHAERDPWHARTVMLDFRWFDDGTLSHETVRYAMPDAAIHEPNGVREIGIEHRTNGVIIPVSGEPMPEWDGLGCHPYNPTVNSRIVVERLEASPEGWKRSLGQDLELLRDWRWNGWVGSSCGTPDALAALVRRDANATAVIPARSLSRDEVGALHKGVRGRLILVGRGFAGQSYAEWSVEPEDDPTILEPLTDREKAVLFDFDEMEL